MIDEVLLDEIQAGQIGWLFQFRFAVDILWSRMPEFCILGTTPRSMRFVIPALVLCGMRLESATAHRPEI